MPFSNPPSAGLIALHQELGIPLDYAERRGLPLQSEASLAELVTIATHGERQIQLIASASGAWTRMTSIARREDIILLPISGFRSVARQAEIIRRRLAAGRSLEAILTMNAAPGYSEHHTGRAVDIGAPGDVSLTASFAGTPAFNWLTAQAHTFGFTLSYPTHNVFGIAYEPWHWLWSDKAQMSD